MQAKNIINRFYQCLKFIFSWLNNYSSIIISFPKKIVLKPMYIRIKNYFLLLMLVSVILIFIQIVIEISNYKEINENIISYKKNLFPQKAKIFSEIEDKHLKELIELEENIKKTYISLNIKKEQINQYNDSNVEEFYQNSLSFFDRNKKAINLINEMVALRQDIIKDLPVFWPVEKGRNNKNSYITSTFGLRYSPFEGRYKKHNGIDIASKNGILILAAADGTVSFAGIQPGYGYTVILYHPRFGYKTLYGHNSTILVESGKKVKQGEPIARLGNTGRTTGYHLHFEILIDNSPIDPAPYLEHEW